jgi:threonylcarbamoyladenosine tRNA methylthiotransferase MtaB
VARGVGRSRPLADVIADVQFALDGESKEIVLTGVHLGSWGQELGAHLRDLVTAILLRTNVPRLRLSSLEPWDLDARFFELWQDARLAPHLHLPLQSGCAATLKRMARHTTPDSFRALVTAARAALPEIAVTTDLIAGFPGETESEFAESRDFVRELGLAGGHVFTYSPRPGTGAARMRDQVQPAVRKERNRILRGILDEAALAYRRPFLGRTIPVLWESTSELGEYGWRMEGWTANYLRVRSSAAAPRWNEVDHVRLTGISGDVLEGVISDSG